MLKRYHGTGDGASFEVLPAIDLVDGRVVRLRQGDFERETRYSDDPVAVATGFALQGATSLHVVDLDGARAGEPRQTDVLARICRAVGAAVEVEAAGGLRTEDAVESAIAAGAARAVLGTAALRDQAFVAALIERYGRAPIVVALDVRHGRAVGGAWLPGTTGVPVAAALTALADAGVAVFEVTAVERDGTLAGPDLGLLAHLVALHRGDVIAAAGISSVDDLRRVRALGCRGAIVGRALYEGRLDLADALVALDPLGE